MRFHVHSQKGRYISSVGEELEQVEPSFPASESKSLCSHARQPSSRMIETEHTHPMIQPFYPKQIYVHLLTKDTFTNIHRSLIIIAKTKNHISNKIGKQIMKYLNKNILFSTENEQSKTRCYGVNKSYKK